MSSPRYTARFPFPELLELGADCVVDCPIYRDGALVAPTSGTLTVTDPSGTEVVAAAAVTITGQIATYTIAAADLPTTRTPEEGWTFVWSLVISGSTYTFRTDGVSVRHRLYPTITDADVSRRLRALDVSLPAAITTRTTYQGDIDEADIEVQNRMLALRPGHRPDLVTRPSALRPLWLATTIAIVFEDLASRNADAYAGAAREWRNRAEAEWSRVSPTFDFDGDGIADANSQAGVSSPELWSC